MVGRRGSRREEKAERGGREVIGGARRVKVEAEGRDIEKEVKKKGSCVKAGLW